MEDKIIELAGAGVPSSVIASTVGCDPSYVSQLLGQEDVIARVSALRMEKAAGLIKHDESIEEAEKIALKRVLQLLPMQTDVMKAAKVFQIMNGAKKAADHGVMGGGSTPGDVVTIQMPAAAHVHFKLTTDRQVIEVEGRSMVPMQSQNVASALRQMQAKRLLENAALPVVEQLPTVSKKTKSIVDQL